MAAWMLYCLAVSAAAALGAAALERALLLYRRPVRWAWAAALLLSLAVPAAAWLSPAAAGPSTTSGQGAGAALDPRLVRVRAAEPGLAAMDLSALDRPLAVVWLAATGATLAALAAMHLALSRRRRAWRPAVLDGAPVLVSDRTGPAVVGFVRGAIVVPEWVLGADGETRRLIVQHEREHLRAGDTRLLLAALAAVAAAAWNPVLWWQLRRLRLAMELDCDARVLHAAGGVRRYGAVLVEVGRRAGGGALGAAAFSEPVSFLERRIQVMTTLNIRARLARALTLAAVAAAAAVAASATPRPAPLSTTTPAAAAPGDTVPQPSAEAIRAAIQSRFPRVLLEGTHGNGHIVFVANEQGQVVRAGVGPDDRAALRSAGGEQAPRTIGFVSVSSYPAGRMGPDALRVTWVQVGTGAEAAAERSGDATPRGTIVAAVEQRFPAVRANGLPEGSKLVFVADSHGRVRSAQQVDAGGALPSISPNDIARVEIFKGNGGITVGGHSVQVVWITTKAG
jgi:beta-lactamase regulating signal transducer with metallopeptidase domain